MNNAENPEIPEKIEIKRPTYTIGDRIVSVAMRGLFTAVSIADLGLKEGLKHVVTREQMVGMLEGGIIAPNLVYPDPENGQLVYEKAAAGQWLGFDPNRSLEFAKEARDGYVRTLSKGVLFRMLPDSIKDNDAKTKTPTWFTDFYHIDHWKTIGKPPIHELISEGIFRATSMAEAYDRLGMSEHIANLEARSLAKDRVYQVTPKGNTLAALYEGIGDTKPKSEPRYRTVTVPGLVT